MLYFCIVFINKHSMDKPLSPMKQFRSFYDEMSALLERLITKESSPQPTLATMEIVVEELERWESGSEIAPKQRELGAVLLRQLDKKVLRVLGESGLDDEWVKRVNHILERASSTINNVTVSVHWTEGAEDVADYNEMNESSGNIVDDQTKPQSASEIATMESLHSVMKGEDPIESGDLQKLEAILKEKENALSAKDHELDLLREALRNRNIELTVQKKRIEQTVARATQNMRNLVGKKDRRIRQMEKALESLSTSTRDTDDQREMLLEKIKRRDDKISNMQDLLDETHTALDEKIVMIRDLKAQMTKIQEQLLQVKASQSDAEEHQEFDRESVQFSEENVIPAKETKLSQSAERRSTITRTRKQWRRPSQVPSLPKAMELLLDSKDEQRDISIENASNDHIRHLERQLSKARETNASLQGKHWQELVTLIQDNQLMASDSEITELQEKVMSLLQMIETQRMNETEQMEAVAEQMKEQRTELRRMSLNLQQKEEELQKTSHHQIELRNLLSKASAGLKSLKIKMLEENAEQELHRVNMAKAKQRELRVLNIQIADVGQHIAGLNGIIRAKDKDIVKRDADIKRLKAELESAAAISAERKKRSDADNDRDNESVEHKNVRRVSLSKLSDATVKLNEQSAELHRLSVVLQKRSNLLTETTAQLKAAKNDMMAKDEELQQINKKLSHKKKELEKSLRRQSALKKSLNEANAKLEAVRNSAIISESVDDVDGQSELDRVKQEVNRLEESLTRREVAISQLTNSHQNAAQQNVDEQINGQKGIETKKRELIRVEQRAFHLLKNVKHLRVQMDLLIAMLRDDVDRVMAAFGEDKSTIREDLSWTERVDLKRQKWVHPQEKSRMDTLSQISGDKHERRSSASIKQMKWIVNDLVTVQKQIIVLMDQNEDYKATLTAKNTEVEGLHILLEEAVIQSKGNDKLLMAEMIEAQDHNIVNESSQNQVFDSFEFQELEISGIRNEEQTLSAAGQQCKGLVERLWKTIIKQQFSEKIILTFLGLAIITIVAVVTAWPQKSTHPSDPAESSVSVGFETNLLANLLIGFLCGIVSLIGHQHLKGSRGEMTA